MSESEKMGGKEKFMRRAIELARRGEGKTSPNPMVGAVIVKDGRIIGEGFHEKAGEPHAERNALRAAREQLAGTELYVTLEPCCHYGKTPPCTEAIIASGIRRVIVGSDDPNPRVAGGGIEQLRRAGIEVERGFLREECDRLNPIFFHYITRGTPYVAMKYAMTADGKTATVTGASKWITGESALTHVHVLRSRYTAIMAGIGTVLADDPLLTCRLQDSSQYGEQDGGQCGKQDGGQCGRQPLRVICDSFLRIPEKSRICETASEVPTVVAALRPELIPEERRVEYEEKRCALTELGIEVLPVGSAQERQDTAGDQKTGEDRTAAGVDLAELMRILGARGVDSILLEGGAVLNDSALRQGIVNKIYVYVAPKIFGGEQAKGPVAGRGVLQPDEACLLRLVGTSRFGGDILLEYELEHGLEHDLKCESEHKTKQNHTEGGSQCSQEL